MLRNATHTLASPISEAEPYESGPRPRFHDEEPVTHAGRALHHTPRATYGAASYRGHGRLAGRVAFVTGGSSGVGRAVALAYAREGADVAFTYGPGEENAAAEAASGLRAVGVECLELGLDLGIPANCTTAIRRAVEHFGRIDILVNSAAHRGPNVRDFGDMDDERIESTVRLNVLAPLILAREALPHMRLGSTIINVSSIQAQSPTLGTLDYATTTGALVTLTKGLAQTLLDRGIRVNSVAPGSVWNEELAPLFVYLASDESRQMSGEVMGLDGGTMLLG